MRGISDAFDAQSNTGASGGLLWHVNLGNPAAPFYSRQREQVRKTPPQGFEHLLDPDF